MANIPQIEGGNVAKNVRCNVVLLQWNEQKRRRTDVRNPRHMPARSEVGDDTPLRLAVAAALAYPDGSMTASGLRREAVRGRLVIERTAGKDYTTLAAIAEMRNRCRLQPKARDWGSGKQDETCAVTSRTEPSGSSLTESIKRARSAAQT